MIGMGLKMNINKDFRNIPMFFTTYRVGVDKNVIQILH